ncbi:MAG: hypothetical protein KKB77_03750 [Bacteroidetes bacterium]|nr:hypothetical protein [Bacteroidota bacterium]
MSEHVCVVYSDLVGWSKQNVSEQVSSAMTLFTHLSARIEGQGLTAIWKASTGDGFAIAFPRNEGVRVIGLCHDLLDQYVVGSELQLRLALAEGTLVPFQNPLTGATDYTGNAVIKARRILDGITYGSTFLIQKDLAQDLLKSLSRSLIPYIVSRPAINDKHGDSHEVVQFLPSQTRGRRGGRKSPQSLQQLVELAKSTEIVKTEKALGDTLFGTDGLIILWIDNERRGLEAAAIHVSPRLEAGSSLTTSIDLKGPFINHAAPYLEETKRKYGLPNNPKLWLKGLRSPLSDRPTLQLTVGRTDYWTSRALELAYEKGSLREEFEKKVFDIYQDTPGILGTHSFIITSDDKLILCQRKGGEVDFAGGSYSPSFEEQCNPTLDNTPYETVLRGLSEEFHLDATHSVHVSIDNLRLFAVGREWGTFWHTVLLFSVKLPSSAAKVMECWKALPPPKDKNEHTGICAVPLRSKNTNDFFQVINQSGFVPSNELKQLSGRDVTGIISDGPLHPTSGKARILLTRYSIGELQ